jgi:integrase
MADKVRGWLRQRERADGMTWLWCYQRLRPSDGKMVENIIRLGLVAEIGDESAAWIKVGELGLVEKYITNPISPKPTFGELCSEYMRDGLPFRKEDGHRKANGTIETYLYHINTFILPRWRNVVAGEMKPLAIRNWLVKVHDEADYTWETCSKIRGIMSLVFSFVDDNEVYSIRNPLDKVTIPASEDEHDEVKVLSPEQTMSLLERLPSPVKFVVLLVAATGIRISECLGLRWFHVKWNESKIQIEQTFRRGEVQRRTKTKYCKGPIPMCQLLSACLAEWRRRSPYSKQEDFVFASPTLNGMQPLWGQTLNCNFVKPAAIALGLIAEGERFGWHCFRHSLSTWADEAVSDLSVPQMLLRHSDPKMTEAYIHRRLEIGLEAQRRFMQQLMATRSVEQLFGGLPVPELLAMVPASEVIQ